MNRRQFLATAAGLVGGVLLSAKKAAADWQTIDRRLKPELSTKPFDDVWQTFQTPHRRHVLPYRDRGAADLVRKTGCVNWFPWALAGKVFEPGTALFIGFSREPSPIAGVFNARVEIGESIGTTWNRMTGAVAPDGSQPYGYWDSPFDRMPARGPYRCCLGDDHGRFCEAKARYWIGTGHDDYTHACEDHVEILTYDGDRVAVLDADGAPWWIPQRWLAANDRQFEVYKLRNPEPRRS